MSRIPDWAGERDAVARGAAWLDAHEPGWAGAIDPALLQMEHCNRCVLGQLFDGFYHGLARIGPPDRSLIPWAVAHGFTVVGAGKRVQELTVFARLTKLWREEVSRRVPRSPQQPEKQP